MVRFLSDGIPALLCLDVDHFAIPITAFLGFGSVSIRLRGGISTFRSSSIIVIIITPRSIIGTLLITVLLVDIRLSYIYGRSTGVAKVCFVAVDTTVSDLLALVFAFVPRSWRQTEAGIK